MIDLNKIELKEIAYSNEVLEPVWVRYLEISRLKKLLANRYNTKQALITALKRLGVSDDLAKNEVLLSTVLNKRFSDDFDSSTFSSLERFIFSLDSTLEVFRSMSFEKVISILDNAFEEIVEEYVNSLKTELIVEEKEDYSLVSFFWTTYSYKGDLGAVQDIDTFFRELVKNNSYEAGEIKRQDILLNRNNKYTTVAFNTTDIIASFGSTCKIISTTNEKIYDSSYKMVSDAEYEYLDRHFDISNFSLANASLYTSMSKLSINKDLKTCRYIQKKEGFKESDFEIDIELEYDKVGFDFSAPCYFQEINPDSEFLICLFERHNHLFKQQLEFYRSGGISEQDYLIQWDDLGFYSIVYDFSKELREKVNELSEYELVELEKRKRLTIYED